MDPAWIAAVISGIGALTTAIGLRHTTKETKRWRGQQRESKQAQVAAEVLVATQRYVAGLKSAASLGLQHSVPDPDPKDEHSVLRTNIRLNWEGLTTIATEFQRAWELAEVHLPDEVNNLLERISGEHTEIMYNQLAFLSMPRGHGKEYFHRGWGKGPQKRLDDLKEEARTLLRSIAQLDPDDNRSEKAAKKMIAMQARTTKQIQAEIAKQLEGKTVKQLTEPEA